MKEDYHPNESGARKNRKESAKNAARTRKRAGTQWRHGRKSKKEIKK